MRKSMTDNSLHTTINEQKRILVTGATGYIGGRLVPRLLKAGHTVRVMTRNAHHLQGRSWEDAVEVVEADVLKPETLGAALQDVDVAYYMIHSMADSNDFAERDATAAHNFGRAASEAGVGQIIYQSGLGNTETDLSIHLKSRHEVGEILREHIPETTEFRAAIIVGAGSVSFEIIRYLTERLPMMLAPRWLSTPTQPIGIETMLDYLVEAINTPASKGQIIQVGGQDVLTYREMLHIYAQERGLKRVILPIPHPFPRLSSYWVHLMTPVHIQIIRPLVASLEHEMVVTDENARQIFPDIKPRTYRTMLKRALGDLTAHKVESAWTDSMAATWEQDEPYTFTDERGMFIERRKRQVNASPGAIFTVVNSLGGETGWLYWNFLWKLRGLMDRAIGGPGYRQRRDNAFMRVGDVVDFWRVEAVKPNEMIRLRAEMKLGGKGWLQYDVQQDDAGNTTLVQTAYYAPHGLPGFLYWYAMWIPHKFIFDGMIDKVVERAEQNTPDKVSEGTKVTQAG